jgi:K+ transporter
LKTQDILPALLSIIVIILVAVFEKQSKLAAAITATMPIGATLALWIVYSANEGERKTMEQFSIGLLVGIIISSGCVALFSNRFETDTIASC